MFETIGNLFTIGFWLVAIFCFLFGIVLCGVKLFTGTGGEQVCAAVGAVLGVITFICMYNWAGSIAWCLLTSGIVAGLISNLVEECKEAANNPPEPPRGPGPVETFTDAYLKEYGEYQRTKQAVKDAIKESKK